MKKLVFATISAFAIAGLAACAEEADETTIVETETADPAVPAGDMDGGVVTDDGLEGRDSVTVSEDGVNADVSDGDTRVRADIDEDPSATVTD